MPQNSNPQVSETERINRRMAFNAQKKDAENLSTVAAAIEEVYENLNGLDDRLEAVEAATPMEYSYDSTNRGIIISNGGASQEGDGNE